jgi:phosphonopyruvate decarboxylase
LNKDQFNLINLSRFEVLKITWEIFQNRTAYFTTTGFTSREFVKLIDDETRFFPCVGGMGYVSSVAFSYAKFSGNSTICVDGDGSLLMHLGALFSIKNRPSVPFLHILINNEVHQSVGNFDIVAKQIDYQLVCKAAGYSETKKITSLEELRNSLLKFHRNPVTTFLHIQVNNDTEVNLPRVRELSKLIERFVK